MVFTIKNSSFVNRWLHFLGDGLSWEGRYEYYHDALCRQPTFTLRAKGSYIGGQESEVITGSKTYSFKTTRLRVTPKDDATADTLNRYEVCWQQVVPALSHQNLAQPLTRCSKAQWEGYKKLMVLDIGTSVNMLSKPVCQDIVNMFRYSKVWEHFVG